MICTVCHREFQNIDNLIKHMKVTHTYEKNFQCCFSARECFRKYANIGTLKKHFLVSHKVFDNNTDAYKLTDPVTNISITGEASSSSNTDILNTADKSNVEIINESSKFNVEVEDGNFNNMQTVDNAVLKFITKLYSNSSITRNVVEMIVDDCSELVQDLLLCLKCTLQCETSFSSDISKLLDNIFDNIKPFEIYSTEYKRLKFFKNSKWLIQPQKFLIEGNVG